MGAGTGDTHFFCHLITFQPMFCSVGDLGLLSSHQETQGPRILHTLGSSPDPCSTPFLPPTPSLFPYSWKSANSYPCFCPYPLVQVPVFVFVVPCSVRSPKLRLPPEPPRHLAKVCSAVNRRDRTTDKSRRGALLGRVILVVQRLCCKVRGVRILLYPCWIAGGIGKEPLQYSPIALYLLCLCV